jgi:hypothetical protein
MTYWFTTILALHDTFKQHIKNSDLVTHAKDWLTNTMAREYKT